MGQGLSASDTPQPTDYASVVLPRASRPISVPQGEIVPDHDGQFCARCGCGQFRRRLILVRLAVGHERQAHRLNVRHGRGTGRQEQAWGQHTPH